MVNAASVTTSTRIYFQMRLRKSGALALMVVIAISFVSPSIVGLTVVPSSLSCALPVFDLPAAITRERSYCTSSPYSPWGWPSWVSKSLSVNPLGLPLLHSRSYALPACTLSTAVPQLGDDPIVRGLCPLGGQRLGNTVLLVYTCSPLCLALYR